MGIQKVCSDFTESPWGKAALVVIGLASVRYMFKHRNPKAYFRGGAAVAGCAGIVGASHFSGEPQGNAGAPQGNPGAQQGDGQEQEGGDYSEALPGGFLGISAADWKDIGEMKCGSLQKICDAVWDQGIVHSHPGLDLDLVVVGGRSHAINDHRDQSNRDIDVKVYESTFTVTLGRGKNAIEHKLTCQQDGTYTVSDAGQGTLLRFAPTMGRPGLDAHYVQKIHPDRADQLFFVIGGQKDRIWRNSRFCQPNGDHDLDYPHLRSAANIGAWIFFQQLLSEARTGQVRPIRPRVIVLRIK